MPETTGGKVPTGTARPVLLSKTRLIIFLSLLAVLITCLVSSWITRDAMAMLPFLRKHARAGAQSTLVDLRPWLTAQELSAMAVTGEEQTYAREVEHLADQEVDDAFQFALRQAQINAQHRALKGDALKLSQRVAQLQQSVTDDKALVRRLTPPPPAATDISQPVAEAATAVRSDELEFANAQLTLDQDELKDSQQDLARAQGDERGQIEQELAAHKAAMRKYDSAAATRSLGAVESSQHYGSVARRVGVWFDQRTRYQLIQQAAQEADSDSKSLMDRHNSMETQDPAQPDSAADRASRLSAMQSRAMHSQMLSIYDNRIQTQSQLGAVYRKWGDQVLLQHQIIFHLLMRSFALLAFILLCALMLDAMVRYFLDRPTADRRIYSFRLISRLSVQVISAVLMLFVIFGTPTEMPTIVGLTTAGLTVVLQDFIISFFGWFVLMGKNGIREGDWVEINGVGGEVVSVGVFRTSLLETGNWTDHGHPTGRRVAFTNSFAIKGQYFNFTTSGQWMWDEVTVTVANSEHVYSTIELIRRAVLEETDKESAMAEEEWKRVGRANGLSQISAAAIVNMRPSAIGIDIVVRYVTRATVRNAVRNTIYQRVIDLLHKPLAIT